MNKIVITILSVALGFISCKDDSTGEISKSDKTRSANRSCGN